MSDVQRLEFEPRRHARLVVPAVLTAAIIALLGLAAVQATRIPAHVHATAALEDREAQLRAAVGRLHAEQRRVAADLLAAQASLRKEISATTPSPDIEAEIQAWFARADRLRQRTDLAIPEFELLTEEGWFAAARDAKFETEEQVRSVFRKLHETARKAFGEVLQQALQPYASAHGGMLPSQPALLAPFAPRAVSPLLFSRYEMRSGGPLAAVSAGEWIIAERPEVAQAFETRMFVTAGASGTEDLTTVSERSLRQALRAFAAANGGQLPSSPEQLLGWFRETPTAAARKSFLETPAADFDAARLRKLLQPE